MSRVGNYFGEFNSFINNIIDLEDPYFKTVNENGELVDCSLPVFWKIWRWSTSIVMKYDSNKRSINLVKKSIRIIWRRERVGVGLIEDFVRRKLLKTVNDLQKSNYTSKILDIEILSKRLIELFSEIKKSDDEIRSYFNEVDYDLEKFHNLREKSIKFVSEISFGLGESNKLIQKVGFVFDVRMANLEFLKVSSSEKPIQGISKLFGTEFFINKVFAELMEIYEQTDEVLKFYDKIQPLNQYVQIADSKFITNQKLGYRVYSKAVDCPSCLPLRSTNPLSDEQRELIKNTRLEHGHIPFNVLSSEVMKEFEFKEEEMVRVMENAYSETNKFFMNVLNDVYTKSRDGFERISSFETKKELIGKAIKRLNELFLSFKPFNEKAKIDLEAKIKNLEDVYETVLYLEEVKIQIEELSNSAKVSGEVVHEASKRIKEFGEKEGILKKHTEEMLNYNIDIILQELQLVRIIAQINIFCCKVKELKIDFETILSLVSEGHFDERVNDLIEKRIEFQSDLSLVNKDLLKINIEKNELYENRLNELIENNEKDLLVIFSKMCEEITLSPPTIRTVDKIVFVLEQLQKDPIRGKYTNINNEMLELLAFNLDIIRDQMEREKPSFDLDENGSHNQMECFMLQTKKLQDIADRYNLDVKFEVVISLLLKLKPKSEEEANLDLEIIESLVKKICLKRILKLLESKKPQKTDLKYLINWEIIVNCINLKKLAIEEKQKMLEKLRRNILKLLAKVENFENLQEEIERADITSMVTNMVFNALDKADEEIDNKAQINKFVRSFLNNVIQANTQEN